jgi:hypothetical protein
MPSRQTLPLDEDVLGPGSGLSSGVLLVRGGARLAGGSGDAHVRVNPEEVARRDRVGLGPVLDLLLLHELLGLPCGLPVPAGELGDEAHQTLGKAPPGVVAFCDARARGDRAAGVTVTRLLQRVVVVEGVSVTASHGWRQAFDRAAGFLSVAPTWIVLSARQGTVRQIASGLLEADAAGMGVAVEGGGCSALRWLVAPAQPTVRGIKAAGWRFEERAFASLLSTHPGCESGARSCL